MINDSGLLRLWDNLKGPKTVIIAGVGGASSEPAGVDLDRCPCDVWTRLGHCVVEGGDVSQIVQGIHQLRVALGADYDADSASRAFKEHRFCTGGLDDRAQFPDVCSYVERRHGSTVQPQRLEQDKSGRRLPMWTSQSKNIASLIYGCGDDGTSGSIPTHHVLRRQLGGNHHTDGVRKAARQRTAGSPEGATSNGRQEGARRITTDFEQLRRSRQAELTAAERGDYAKAHSEADLAGTLAELVYRLRSEAGITQTELARRMRSAQSSIARIEAGGSTPTLDLLDRLGKALDVTLTLKVGGHSVDFGAPSVA